MCIILPAVTCHKLINKNMKYIITVLLMCAVLPCLAQQRMYTAIKGKVESERLKDVKLFRTVDGSTQLYAMTQIGPDGSFGFLFEPEEVGFYSIGDDRLNFPVYVKGGEIINIDLLETRAKLHGENTKENKMLYLWADYAADVRLMGVFFDRCRSTYEDFFPAFESYLQGLEALKKKLKTGNKEFDGLLRQYIDYETDFYAIMLVQTPRTKHPEASMLPDFYKHIVSDKKFTDDVVLRFPSGVKIVESYVLFAGLRASSRADNDNLVDRHLEYLHDDRLKGEYVVNSEFRRFKSYDQYLTGMEKYEKYFVTPSLKRRAEAVGSKLYDTRAGGQAADFTYPDMNGKMVSLSDFKGKVVLVDVWATWCGPCRGEIPHLKKLEEEMHGKDVVFLGVSVDEVKDKQKWIEFIKKEGLKGIQVLADGWSKITKDYKITGIPRFMVFDRRGNIVSVDAPRPSKPELKKMLEAELNK